MDVAYLFATVNQLRTAYQLASPYEGLVVGLLIFSLVLQVNTCLWLVNTDHVTWILASDWSMMRCSLGPRIFDLSSLTADSSPLLTKYFLINANPIVKHSKHQLHSLFTRKDLKFKVQIFLYIVKPKSEVPKSKVPKSGPKGLGLTLKSHDQLESNIKDMR